MNWKNAKRHELYVIAFDDPYATLADKLEVAEEIERRRAANHQHSARMHVKRQVSYPR